MFRMRKPRRVPGLNTTSTADISFMLLTFFLVTTSMDTDKGLLRKLPPMPQENIERAADVKKRNIMSITVDSDNRLYCDGKLVSTSALRRQVALFVENKDNSPAMPEKTVMNIPLLGRCSVAANHVIAIQVDRNASYDTYFNMQNAIVLAYSDLRDRQAHVRFRRPYKKCTKEQREAIAACYPIRISEAVSQGGFR